MALAILIFLVGIWVIINTVNGNLPGIAQGSVTFNRQIAPTVGS